jgi:hypothetical protein
MAVNGKVVVLHADSALIAHLESLLASARTGKLRSLATVHVDPNRDPQLFWYVDAPRDTHAFSAGIGDLHFRIFLRRLEHASPAEPIDDDDSA